MSVWTPELAARIRDEITLIDREAREAEHAWMRATLNKQDGDYLLKAVALTLHTFYSGIERVFELIARQLDGEVPTGAAWHRDLLYQMTVERQGVRPPVITQEDADGLAAFLGFRHVVRNIYSHSLQPHRIGALITELAPVWQAVHEHLDAWLALMRKFGG